MSISIAISISTAISIDKEICCEQPPATNTEIFGNLLPIHTQKYLYVNMKEQFSKMTFSIVPVKKNLNFYCANPKTVNTLI